MATRLKTVEYTWDSIRSLIPNDTLTTGLSTPIFIPEASASLKEVTIRVCCDDVVTVTGGTVSTALVGFRFGSGSWSDHSHTWAKAHSGENISWQFVYDLTAAFLSAWSGTENQMELRFHFKQDTGTTLGMVNTNATLRITYEYDDTEPVQVKTIWLPLDAPAGLLATSRPATPADLIPALDTFLPEAGKVFHETALVIQGTTYQGGSTTAHTLFVALDGEAAIESGIYEGALLSDRAVHYIAELSFDTSVPHDLYLWASHERMPHSTAYLHLTYSFTLAGTTRMMNSLLLPEAMTSPVGQSVSDYRTAIWDFFVVEPNPSLARAMVRMVWTSGGSVISMTARVNEGTWSDPYIAVTTMPCGSSSLARRVEGEISLVRGRNTITFDAYSGSSNTRAGCPSALLFFCYTSDVPDEGVGAANHTVRWSLWNQGLWPGNVANYLTTIPSRAFLIPEPEYFISAIGIHGIISTTGTGLPTGAAMLVERLAGEGGVGSFTPLYTQAGYDIPEVGFRHFHTSIRNVFRRFPGDNEERMNIEETRRWTFSLGSVNEFGGATLLLTYHANTFLVSGAVSGVQGKEVSIVLVDDVNGERLRVLTSQPGGAYQIPWYDDTRQVYVSVVDSDTPPTLAGRSLPGSAL